MYELANTSLPNGLIAGTHGFATVAMTKGLPDALRTRLEALCAYTHKASSHDASYQTQNPVNWFHAVLPQGEHVLGRVAASDFDYTGRTNRLARLLVFPSREMPAVGAAEVLSAEASRLSAPWSGEPRYLAEDEAAASRLAAIEPAVFATPSNWTTLLGADSAELARRFALLLERNIKSGGRPIYFKTSATFDQNGSKLLGLFSDLIALLPPELRASATFSTYPAAIPNGTKIHLLGAFEGDRNFAVAASTQPWVDCEKGVVNHADMLPVPVEKPAAAPSREEQGTTLSAVSAAEESAQRKPLRLKQNEPAPNRRQPTGHAFRTYLPPKRNDDKTFALVLSVTAAAIVAAAVGTFFYLQNVAGRKRAEAERIAAEQRAKQEEEERQTILSNAIEEYKSRVDNAVKQLNDIKFRIGTTDNPKHFEEEVLPGARREADVARENAKSKGADDAQLRISDNDLEEAVAAVMAAIKERKRILDEEHRKAKADDDSAKQEIIEVTDTPKEPTSDEKPEPEDASPAFCKAEKVKIVYLSDITDSGFVERTGQMTVFYYATDNRDDLLSEAVTMIKLGSARAWSPKPQTILAKSKGVFTLWYCEKDKTLYWLWDLNRDKTAGQWFAAEGGDANPQNNLKIAVFGLEPTVFEVYNRLCGKPTYAIDRELVRESDGEQLKRLGIDMETHLETGEDQFSIGEPSPESILKGKRKLESVVIPNLNNLYEYAKSASVRNKAIVEQIEEAFQQIKTMYGEKEQIENNIWAKDNEKKQTKDSNKRKKIQQEIDELNRNKQSIEANIKSIGQRIHKAAQGIAVLVNENDFNVKTIKDLEDRWRIPQGKLNDLKASTPDHDQKCISAKRDLEKAQEYLANYDANVAKEWRKVAQASVYWISGVTGSKEVKPGER